MLSSKMKRMSSTIAITAVFSISSAVFANGDDLKSLLNNQEDIKSEMNTKKTQMEEALNQSAKVKEEVKEIDENSTRVLSELIKVEKEMEELLKEIEATEVELKKAEDTLIEKQDSFQKRLRVMHKTGDMGYLEILLNSKDINDFFIKKDMIVSILEQDKKLLKLMKEQTDIASEKRTELEVQRKSLTEVKRKIESRKQELNETMNEKTALMNNIQTDADMFKLEFEELEKASKNVEDKIVKMQEEHKKNEENKIRASAKSKEEGDRLIAEYRKYGQIQDSLPKSYQEGKMAWPVPGYNRISSPFGNRIHPIFKTKKMHTGVDIPAPSGVPLVSADDGTVIHSGGMGGYGNTIMVDHGGGVVTLYAHNSTLIAKKGQKVKKGDLIAKIGSTGYSTGPHSHFEVRLNGKYVDPTPYIK